MDLYLIKPISHRETPDPYNIFIDHTMEANSRYLNFADEEFDRYVRLSHNSEWGYWNYDYNWVIKLKRKECSQI